MKPMLNHLQKWLCRQISEPVLYARQCNTFVLCCADLQVHHVNMLFLQIFA
jgi:hypothetical protein